MNYLKQLRQQIGSTEIFINCAAVWLETEHGVLLERRSDDGRWGLLGGIMELGESPMDTAIREVKEETGFDVAITHLIGIYTQHRHTYPNGDKAQPIVFFFNGLIAADGPPRTSRESIELRYFPHENLPTLGMQQHQVMMADALAQQKNMLR